jgi:hypothetical protein
VPDIFTNNGPAGFSSDYYIAVINFFQAIGYTAYLGRFTATFRSFEGD